MLLNGDDMHLCVLKSMLLPFDRPAILHAHNSMTNISQKICHNLVFVSICNFRFFLCMFAFNCVCLL